MEFNKDNRKTFLQDRSRSRKKKHKASLSEDTLAMQRRYQEEGYFSISEIAFLMANESYEDLSYIESEYGTESQEYDLAHKRANAAVKTALPYFAIQMKADIQIAGNEVTSKGVEEALAEMLKPKR